MTSSSSCLVCHHQRNPTALGHERMLAHPARTGLLALTFGTLLSSQGTDAHRIGSLDRLQGNPTMLPIESGLVKPTGPAPPALLRAAPVRHRCDREGGCRRASWGPSTCWCPLLPTRATVGTLRSGERRVKSDLRRPHGPPSQARSPATTGPNTRRAKVVPRAPRTHLEDRCRGGFGLGGHRRW
jgi:hypothetical protein